MLIIKCIIQILRGFQRQLIFFFSNWRKLAYQEAMPLKKIILFLPIICIFIYLCIYMYITFDKCHINAN